MKHLVIPLLVGTIPLAACEGDRLTFNSIADSLHPQDAISQGGDVDYHQGGGVTQTQVNNLRNYARNQPPQAMRKLLGSPNRVGSDYEVYDVRGTGNDYQASSKLIVRYEESADCDYQCHTAIDWYQQGN